MSELPPAERRPEPFAGSAARDRVAAVPLAANSPATLQPTRDLSHDMLGQTLGGRYIVRGVLGEGGMGTVYDAEHIGLGRHVAIKVLNPSQAKKRVAVKRFQQEARAAGAIGHPNICEVYDMGLLDDGSPYLVMEKLVGETLADRINKEGGLPFDELVELMIQVLSGLIAAHEKGIVHRDIKPENIFLARRVGCPPIVKLLDFGVSKMLPQYLNGGEEQLDLTRTGMVMGTPYYMSPEQARGERNLDGRVDVYATGVMMYEAIAGKRPFLAPNYNALLLAIINTQPRPLREVRPATPPALEAIVARAMAKNRDQRYPSAMHVLRDIQSLTLSTGGGAAVRVPPPPTREERMRAPVLGGGGGTKNHREPADRPDSPSARLRSGMNEGAGRETNHEPATRLDIRVRGLPQMPGPADSDSIDIPIHMTGSETPVLPMRREGPPPSDDAPANAEYVDEAPTEIFRPGKHPPLPGSRPPASRRSAARSVPPPVPVPRKAPPPPPAPAQPPADDWDGETVVVREPHHAVAHGKEDVLRGVNPEQTIKLDGRSKPKVLRESEPADIDFSDETRMMPPRRPR